MKRVRQLFRWIVVVGVCIFVIVQFIRPARTNPTVDPSQAIESHLEIDSRVNAILERSCTDCHSNKTHWPWYSKLSPVSWWVVDHVNEGRGELNFSKWGSYSRTDQAEKLRQICREVESGAMPLSSYTPMHPGSALTADDVQTLCDWTNAERARLRQ